MNADRSTEKVTIDWALAVNIGKAQEVVEDIQERFTSGNSVPVERAMIRADEWADLLRFYEALLAENERLRTTLGRVPTNPSVDYVLQVYKLETDDESKRAFVYVDSPTVPGLHCMSDTAEKALACAPAQVARLRKDNAPERMSDEDMAEVKKAVAEGRITFPPEISKSCSEMGAAVGAEDGGCSRPICRSKAGPAEVLPAVCGSQTAGSERAGGHHCPTCVCPEMDRAGFPK